jgi:hypothetical protein
MLPFSFILLSSLVSLSGCYLLQKSPTVSESLYKTYESCAKNTIRAWYWQFHKYRHADDHHVVDAICSENDRLPRIISQLKDKSTKLDTQIEAQKQTISGQQIIVQQQDDTLEKQKKLIEQQTDEIKTQEQELKKIDDENSLNKFLLMQAHASTQQKESCIRSLNRNLLLRQMENKRKNSKRNSQNNLIETLQQKILMLDEKLDTAENNVQGLTEKYKLVRLKNKLLIKKYRHWQKFCQKSRKYALDLKTDLTAIVGNITTRVDQNIIRDDNIIAKSAVDFNRNYLHDDSISLLLKQQPKKSPPSENLHRFQNRGISQNYGKILASKRMIRFFKIH